MRTLLHLALAGTCLACSSSSGGDVEGASGPGARTTTCQPSGWDGDELCIEPPAAGEGVQIHVGPAAYDDESVAPFVLEGGDENVLCYHLKAPNRESFYYFEQKNRMRPGSHHMILRVLDGDAPDGWGPCERTRQVGGIPGSQSSSRDFPGKDVAPENVGLGRTLPANAQLEVELHYVNTTTEPLLREAWVNLYEKPPEEVTGTIRGIFMVGGLGMNVAPKSRQVLDYGCDIGGASRIFELTGHFHAHTERFSAWRVRGGERTLVFESYNWAEPDVMTFDSLNQNPTPDRDAGRDGGPSGPLEVQAGDRFEWQCEVNNTLETPLRFANEAYTAEMCILMGGYVADEPRTMGCIVP